MLLNLTTCALRNSAIIQSVFRSQCEVRICNLIPFENTLILFMINLIYCSNNHASQKCYYLAQCREMSFRCSEFEHQCCTFETLKISLCLPIAIINRLCTLAYTVPCNNSQNAWAESLQMLSGRLKFEIEQYLSFKQCKCCICQIC